MWDIFSYHLAVPHKREGLLFATSEFFLLGHLSQFSNSLCFALKPRFLIYGFALENYSGNVEQTNFSSICFLWYLLPLVFVAHEFYNIPMFLWILIIFIKSGNGNVNIFSTQGN